MNFRTSDAWGATTINATVGSVVTVYSWYNDVYDPLVEGSEVGQVDLVIGHWGGTILGTAVTAGNCMYSYQTTPKDSLYSVEYTIMGADNGNGALTAGLDPALVAITFQCGSTPGAESVYAWDWMSYAPGVTDPDQNLMTNGWGMTINVVPVPEPATIALLAIGGLLLRKKK
ncbi:MAG: PEP-CTERM sorting domain-containing protein [Sedimentisphaerales bacterium]